MVGIGEPMRTSEMQLEVLLPRFRLSVPGAGVLTVSTGLSVSEMTECLRTGVIDTILAGCAVPVIGLSKPVGRSRVSVLIYFVSSFRCLVLSCLVWSCLVLSYRGQLVPKTTRTLDNSYPIQLVHKTTRTQDNSYPRQLVPRTTRTQDNSYSTVWLLQYMRW